MKQIYLFLIILFITLVMANTSYAEANRTSVGGNIGKCPTDRVCLNNPLGTTDPNVLIGMVIRAVLGLVGSLALVMFIYGGFTWMTAAGSSEKVTKGKDIIIWATIGLIVIFSAYALVKFVLTGLGVS